MSKIFSGHQPNFLPYMGYFYKIFVADVFILDDDVQFSSKEYHNYNFVKSSNKEKLKITVPVSYNFGDKINEVKVCYKQDWKKKMLTTIKYSYGKAKHFNEVFSLLEEVLNKDFELLVDLNIYLLKEILKRFDIKTKIVIASKDVPTDKMNNERNVYQCKTLGCDVYYSGIGGKNYNDIEMYNKEGIEVVYSDYEPLHYKQVTYCFLEDLSVLDYIMNEGFVIPEDWRKKWKKN